MLEVRVPVAAKEQRVTALEHEDGEAGCPAVRERSDQGIEVCGRFGTRGILDRMAVEGGGKDCNS